MRFTLQPSCWDAQVAEFRTLRLSLNAPVIAIDELPVGPARAGIALGVGASGSLCLQIAIRSLRSGQVIAFAPGSDPADEEEAARALDAGFSFAEGMGFLFDDDEVAVRDAAELDASWRELVGESALREAPLEHSGANGSPVPIVDLIHEVSVHAVPAKPDPVPVDFDAPPLCSDEDSCAAVLSKHRLVLGGVGSEAVARRDHCTTEEAIQEASVHAQNTRIRLLSRF